MINAICEGITIDTYPAPGGGVRVRFAGFSDDDTDEVMVIGVGSNGITFLSGSDDGKWYANDLIYLTGLLVGSLGAIGA